MGEPNIKEMLIQFHNDPKVQKLLARYSRKSVSEIYGVNRRELSHSYFLAWLFDSNEDHGLGATACNKLMMLLALSDKADEKNSKILNRFIAGHHITFAIAVKENVVTGGRLDIYIESDICGEKFRVIIECKVGAKETKDQTQQYYNCFEKRGDDFTNIYVYLTPFDAEPPKCDKYIRINYQDIIDYVLNPILTEEHLSPRTRFIIEDYILALEKPAEEFTEDGNKTKKKENIIMGTSNEMSELLTSFWDNHQNLIINAVKALRKEDPNNPDIEDLDNTIEKVNRNRKTILRIKCNNEEFYGPQANDTLVKFAEYLYKSYPDKWNERVYRIYGIENEIGKVKVKGRGTTRPKCQQIADSPYYIRTHSSTERKKDVARGLAKYFELKDYIIEIVDKKQFDHDSSANLIF